MLQFGGTLACASARRTQRASWWIAAQNLLSCPMATSPNPALDNLSAASVPSEKSSDETKSTETVNKKAYKSRSLITATFKSLSIASEKVTSNKTKELNDSIKAATNLNELLAVTDDPEFNQQNAAILIPTLYDWISDGRIKYSDFQNNNKYWKAYHLLGLNKRPSLLSRNNDDPLAKVLHSDQQIEKIKNLNVFQMITVLSKLASKQQRQTPVLQTVAGRIVNSAQQLNIKLLADILYSVSVLSFYDSTLMEKISKDLLNVIPDNQSSAVIGSILRSIGVLRYRDEPLLDLLSVWIVNHHKIIRPQEINNLLLTLAHLGYIPKNMDELLQKVIVPLKESDMCNSSEWLDVIWSLTVLNHAVPEQYESVLNSNFLNRLFDESEISVPKAIKVLNVNAAAQYTPNYKGQLLPDDSPLFLTSIPRSKEKVDLANSINSALKILAPSDSHYLSTNVNTKMGFILDAEFCVDNKSNPVASNTKSSKEKEIFRIGILTCSYHDFCRGVTEITGPIKFYFKLLEKQNYTTMVIPYTDVNIKAKLIQRVQYIKDNIKSLVVKTSKE